MSRMFVWCAPFVLLLLVGCPDRRADESADGQSPPPKPAAVKLRVLIVDDADLATAVNLLRGEWAEQSGGEIEVEQTTATKLRDAESPGCDLLVFPSRHLGEIVERNWLRPVRESVLSSERFALTDILPAIRNQIMRLGGTTFVVSLGEPPLMFGWNSIDVDLPTTWSSVTGTGRKANLGARELFARMLANYGGSPPAALLFDPATMQPRLDDPALVRALEAMAPSPDVGDPLVEYSIDWPRRVETQGTKVAVFRSLPTSVDRYDALRKRWQPNDNPREVVILGFGGYLVGVTNETRNAASAFRLLAWLTSGEPAARVSQRSPATLWFRTSQSGNAADWLGKRPGLASTETIITRLLSAEQPYVLPRIIAIDDYLAALESAVQAVAGGDRTPAKALEAIAAEFEAITDRVGRDRQRAAYRRHLGLESQD